MSTFSCPVVRVAEVVDHPGADRLSIVKLEGLGYTCISAKISDGSPRYREGDYVVYIPSAAVLPEWLLKSMEFWNAETGKGMLAGTDGNRVKPLRLRGVFSEGILFPTLPMSIPDACMLDVKIDDHHGDHGMPMLRLGEDASEVLGITKWSPPIPVAMAGEVANLLGHTIRYNFERLESVPDMFEPGEPVVASEKLHGSMISIIFEPGLNHPEMFGRNGEIIVHSKGLGSQGLAFKNNSANDGNVYVRALNALLAGGFEDQLNELRQLTFRKIALVGEIFGKGIQDLHYGMDKPAFRVFDICVDDKYCNNVEFSLVASTLGVEMVPVVYQGPFDISALERVRDGKTMLGGANIREGIVVRSATEARHEIHGRKICKMISEAYLLRNNKNASEYQ
jgi:RNA ligase (TIGR02306 family)